ncbi:MAG: phosphoribosylformylglycinamidine cyclo-ligase [Candidatus Susulua stagnicola]|nr:phosphoribosylformylglycinamidine cyclo-ligase [Candidatus Susulua stagnicola]
MKITYKKAGVDIKKGEDFAKRIKVDNVSKVEAFGSLFRLQPLLKKYKNPLLASSTDGVGTKLKIAQYVNIHNTVGVDLVAMNVNDIVCIGAKPLFFLDYIACGKVNIKTLIDVVSGIKRGLEDAECLLLGGETAEMPGMYKKGEYDLAGFCVGIVDKNKIIDGRRIKEGDLVIGLESNGIHSNGFTLVRKVFGLKGLKKYKKEVLKPTRIYVKPIFSLLSALGNNYSALKGIAHVTGGAFYNKVTKILPKGYGAVIDKKTWKVPKIFDIIQKKAHLGQKEMYTVFNMGIGMVLIVDKKFSKKTLTTLNKSCKTHLIGKIIKSNKRMTIV